LLVNLLPGLREIRAPLVSGYLWLVFLFLAFHEELPSSSKPGPVLEPVFDLAGDLSAPAIAAVTGVAAYLVGSAMQELWKLLGRMLSPGRPLYGEAGIRTSPTGRADVRDAVRSRLQGISSQLAQVAISPGERGIAPAPEPDQIERELPLIRTLLLGERPELVGELDRLQAEADLRITVAFPLAFFAVFLALEAGSGWVALLAPALLLLLQGYQRQLDAGDLIAKAMKIGKAEAPTLEAMSASVASVLQRVELEAELRKRMDEGDGLAAFQLGNLQASWDDYEVAAASLKFATDQGVVRAYAELGLVCERRGDVERAERAYRDGAQRDDEKANSLLAELLRRLDREEEARVARGKQEDRTEVDAESGEERRRSEMYRNRMAAGDPKGGLNLGLLLMRQGDVEGAAEALAGATELDPDDPLAWWNLGRAQARRGHSQEAREAYERALELHERQLGPDHLEVARDLLYLADLLSEVGDYEESRNLCERALTIREAELGPRHRGVAEVLTQLAAAVFEFNEFERGRRVMERAVSIIEEADPSERAIAITNSGWMNRELGDYDRARALEEEALELKQADEEVDSESLGVTLYGLGVVSMDLGDLPAAVAYLERSIDRFASAGTAAEIRLAQSLLGMARALTISGWPDQAEPMIQRAMKIQERRLPPLHPQRALTLMAIAEMTRQTGDLEGSEAAYGAALAIFEENPNRAALALCLRGLAETLLALGKTAAALGEIGKAIDIQREALPDPHPELATTYELLHRTLFSLGETGAAGDALGRAQAIRKAL